MPSSSHALKRSNISFMRLPNASFSFSCFACDGPLADFFAGDALLLGDWLRCSAAFKTAAAPDDVETSWPNFLRRRSFSSCSSRNAARRSSPSSMPGVW